MKKISLLILSLILVFLTSGCLKNELGGQSLDNKDMGKNNQEKAVIPEPKENSLPDQSPAPVKEVKSFFPDQAVTSPKNDNSPSSVSDKAQERQKSFTVSNELIVGMYLADKYDPGICYGLPVTIPDSAIKSKIAYEPELAEFLRQKYNLKSDLDVYNKMKQLQSSISLEFTGGKYKFNILDGQCCTQKKIEGTVEYLGGKISDTIIRQETKNNPC